MTHETLKTPKLGIYQKTTKALTAKAPGHLNDLQKDEFRLVLSKFFNRKYFYTYSFAFTKLEDYF